MIQLLLLNAKAKIERFKMQILVAAIFVFSALPAFAQEQDPSVSISLDAADLDGFFSWFNTMFGAILPIALIGAGLVAGAAFAFAVGNMLKKAFQSLSSGA